MSEHLAGFLQELVDKQIMWPLYVVIIVPLALQVFTAFVILIEKMVTLAKRGKATEMEGRLTDMLDARLSDMINAHNNVGRVLGRLESLLR